MRKIYSLVIILTLGLFFNNNLFAQAGCTDQQACNYDLTAVTDDNSCTYPYNVDTNCDDTCVDSAFLPVTLTWTGAEVGNSVTVNLLDGTQIFSASFPSIDGSGTACFDPAIATACFNVTIDAVSTLLWDLSLFNTETSEILNVVSGDNNSDFLGENCNEGCTDVLA